MKAQVSMTTNKAQFMKFVEHKMRLFKEESSDWNENDNELLAKIEKNNRKVIKVDDGSVVITIMCPTLEALNDLRQMYTDGKLLQMFVEEFVPEELRSSITLSVTIDETEMQCCRQQLITGEWQC